MDRWTWKPERRSHGRPRLRLEDNIEEDNKKEGGFIRLRVGSSEKLFEHANEPLQFIKSMEILDQLARLSASEEELCYRQFVPIRA